MKVCWIQNFGIMMRRLYLGVNICFPQNLGKGEKEVGWNSYIFRLLIYCFLLLLLSFTLKRQYYYYMHLFVILNIIISKFWAQFNFHLLNLFFWAGNGECIRSRDQFHAACKNKENIFIFAIFICINCLDRVAFRYIIFFQNRSGV